MVIQAQSWQNSCGAACLLCAAMELGINAFPGNFPVAAARGSPLLNNPFCERFIYQNLTNGVGPNPNTWGYSMPSGIVICARNLGLVNTYVIGYSTWSVLGVQFIYRNEMNTLNNMQVLQRNAAGHSTQTPINTERELKVLLGRGGANLGGMHYVMVRPDLTVMEPARGVNDINIGTTKAAINMHGTGLSIMVC